MIDIRTERYVAFTVGHRTKIMFIARPILQQTPVMTLQSLPFQNIMATLSCIQKAHAAVLKLAWFSTIQTQ